VGSYHQLFSSSCLSRGQPSHQHAKWCGTAGALQSTTKFSKLHPGYLDQLSRFDQTPGDSVIELTTDNYVLHETGKVALEIAQGQLLAFLPMAPDAKTCQELAELTNTARRTVERRLEGLVASGQAIRTGAGIRSHPYRFYRNSTAGGVNGR
jgi:hypothetical protein